MANSFLGLIPKNSVDCISSSKRDSFSHLTKEQLDCNKREGIFASNLWLQITLEYSEELAAELRRLIMLYGLTDTIAACADLADLLVLREESIPGSGWEGIPVVNWLYPFCQLLQARFPDFPNPETGDCAATLQILRFCKRFAYPYDPVVETVALSRFYEINNKHRSPLVAFESKFFWDVLTEVRENVSIILKGYRSLSGRDGWRITPRWLSYCSFTAGAVAERGVKGMAAKITQLWSELPFYGDLTYPSPSYRGSGGLYDPSLSSIARVHVVPKNYKQGRTIAMISTVKQYLLSGVRKALEERIVATTPEIHLGDQEANQAFAQQGSTGILSYATVDFSAASDSISRQLARAILPDSVWADIDPLMDTRMAVGGKSIPCHIFALSGTSVTWDLESVIFLAIARTATNIAARWLGCKLLPPHVYGDDTVIDLRALDTFYDLTCMLGMEFNRSKTFSAGRYRESCGCEYLCGFDVHSIYYPRGGVGLWTKESIRAKRLVNPEALEAAIALQHRLLAANTSFKAAGDYVAMVVRGFYPDMTSHVPGTDCADLWETFPVFQRKLTRYYPNSALDNNRVREGHYSLENTLVDRYGIIRGSYSGLELYAYLQYLQHGPDYRDGLSRLLRISTSRLDTIQKTAGTPSTKWRIVSE